MKHISISNTVAEMVQRKADEALFTSMLGKPHGKQEHCECWRPHPLRRYCGQWVCICGFLIPRAALERAGAP